MEIYDIVMIVVLVGAMLFGAVKGLAWQVASIASIVASYLVAVKFREPFSRQIDIAEPWNRILAMLILYIASALLIWVAFRMVSGSIDRLKLKEFDRHIGAVFGLIKGGLYCILITLFAVTLAGEQVCEKVVASKSGHYIADFLDQTESIVPVEIQEILHPYLEQFDEKFRSPDGHPGGGGTLGENAAQFATDLLTPGADPAAPWSPEQLLQRAAEVQRQGTGRPAEIRQATRPLFGVPR